MNGEAKRFEAWRDRLYSELNESHELVEEDFVELEAVLGNRSFRRALAEVMERKGELADSVMTLDLSKPENVARAIERQGEARGMSLVLEGLLGILEKKHAGA